MIGSKLSEALLESTITFGKEADKESLRTRGGVLLILGAAPAGVAPDAIADSTPVGCMSFYNPGGAGWQDLVMLHGWPGEIVAKTEVTCCSDPVSDQMSSRGYLKRLYR